MAVILVLSTATLAFFNAGMANRSELEGLQEQLSSVQSATATTTASTAQSSASTQWPTGATGAPTGAQAQVIPTTRHVTLVAEDDVITIAKNVTYDAWTFNGTVPGPTITVNQGDTVDFKLINNGTMGHSIDFHAAQVDWSTDYAVVPPGQTKSFNFTVNYPGVFMYHCGTPPVLEHIGNGMYGAIIVNPSTPLPPATGGEYVLVESDFYLNARPGPDGDYAGNYTKMLAVTPTYVVFNGKANQYQTSPLQVLPNQRVRLYLLNAGPNLAEAFHVIGTLLDTVYIEGNPANVQHGLQTLSIPPSGGAIVDLFFTDPGGKNPFVNHAFAYASIGAVGAFAVAQGTTSSTSTSTSTAAAGSVAAVHVSMPAGAGMNTAGPGYSPASITVVIGVNNTVVWTNDDSMPHTVTAVDKNFDSGNMNQGETFTYTFSTPGTYQYVCSYHPWMKGTVIVKA